MNGLLKNCFYGALGSAKILLAFFLAAGMALLISGNPTLLNVFGLITATVFSFNAVSSVRKEAATKWNKYELTAPVRRKDIVKCRYINHIIWISVGIVLSAIFIGLTALFHGNNYFYYEVRDPLTLFCVNTATALLMGTLFYPAIYFFGTDRSEIMIILSVLGAIGLTLGTIWAINAGHNFSSLSDPEYFLCMVVFMAVAIASFILSYFLTNFIYRKKEY
ncbi:MAG TPA: ABC-2 transporter permease [Treponema sp.]|nr:ABC-2 transporter permease [Treponema sp.]